MPIVDWTLNEVQKNITRPVVNAVARNYYELLGLDAANMSVRYEGDGGAIITPGSSIDDKTQVRLPTDKRLEIDYEEEYDEAFIRSTPVHRAESPYIFFDPTTKVVVRPVRQMIRSTITIRVFGADKQQVGILLRKYKTLISRDVDQLGHKLSYSYDVPPPILNLLIDVYKLRENLSGYMENLDTWFNKCFVPNRVTAYSLDAKNPVCKIAESSINAVSYFINGDEIPKKEKENEAGGWYAELQIGFYWERPESMVVEYPIRVHNQFLPPQYLLIDEYKANLGDQYKDPLYYHYPLNGTNEYGRGGLRQSLLSRFGYDFRGSRSNYAFKGVQDPIYFDWIEPILDGPYRGYQTFVREIVIKDQNDPTYITDLGEFHHYELGEHAKEYLKGTLDTLNDARQNVFSLALYLDGELINQSRLQIRSNGELHLDRPIDDRENFTLLYLICNDPSLLSDGAKEELACYPLFYFDYLYLISPDIGCKSAKKLEEALALMDETSETCLPNWVTDEIWEEVQKETNTVGFSKNKIMKTVGIFDIVSYKRELLQ